MKKVSVGITVFNQAHYIGEALESVLSQDYPNLEVVVSDNCSTDTIESTMSSYICDSRVKFFRNEQNIGMVANARKALYEHSSGELALHLDADDYLIDHKYISKAVNLLEHHKLVMVFSRIKAFYEKKNILVEDKVNRDLPEIIDGNWFFLNYYKGYSMPTLTVLHDRHEAMRLGFFEKNIRSSDWESLLRLMVNHKIGFIDEFVGVWRRHGQNETMKQDFDKVILNIDYIESPYRFVLSKRIFPKEVAEKWRKLMLKRYFAKILVTAVIIKDREFEKNIYDYLRQHYINIYESLRMDIRFRILSVIAENPVLIRFVFKNVFGQESFARDFQHMN